MAKNKHRAPAESCDSLNKDNFVIRHRMDRKLEKIPQQKTTTGGDSVPTSSSANPKFLRGFPGESQS